MSKISAILITGGAGFMGSNFIRYILSKYPRYYAVNLDKLTYAGNLDNLKDVLTSSKSRYKFIKGDIANQKLVESIFKKEGIEVVINFAAESHVDRSILGPRQFVKTDVLGTLTLLEAARHSSIKKFVQVSTDEVYGEVKRGASDENYPFHPRSPYSASKAGGDHLVLAYYYTYQLPVIRIHSCNFYGPYQYPEKFIPLFITNFLEGKKAPLYGEGQQVREWIFVHDFCQALDLVLHKGQIGEVYNIGTGYRKKNIDVAQAIANLLRVSDNRIVRVKDRPGHDFRYAIDASKIKKLGFKSEFSFLEGLRQTVKWYQENEKWWKKIKKSFAFQRYYERQYQSKIFMV
jgi:dTDP-glucose 4,6-dehydratase